MYLLQFATILTSVLNTLQFVHVETGQTPEESIAVIKATTHQGISHQDNSLISQVLSNLPEITNSNEACHPNIADKISKGEISINSVLSGFHLSILDDIHS